MYKIIKREVFKNGELTETVYEVRRDGYYETVIEIKDWEQFKKAVAEAK